MFGMKKPAALETGLFPVILRQRSFAVSYLVAMDFAFFGLPRMGKSQTLRHGSDSYKAFGVAGAPMCMFRACFSCALLCKKNSAPKTPSGYNG